LIEHLIGELAEPLELRRAEAIRWRERVDVHVHVTTDEFERCRHRVPRGPIDRSNDAELPEVAKGWGGSRLGRGRTVARATQGTVSPQDLVIEPGLQRFDSPARSDPQVRSSACRR